jgi:uncharacterized protein (UPF0332 family)
VSPEARAYLDKARRALQEAGAVLDIDLTEAAGRAAYLAAFHAAQALIFQRAGTIAKTHSGVRSEFARLTRGDPAFDRDLSAFLARAYALKEVADYETGENAVVPRERAETAIETAARFLDCISHALAEPSAQGPS